MTEAVLVALIVTSGPIVAAYLKRRLDRIEETGRVTHDLVNHQHTDAKRLTLASTRRELAYLRSLVALQRKVGVEVSPEDVSTIEATRQSIDEQQAELDSMDAQTREAVDNALRRHRS